MAHYPRNDPASAVPLLNFSEDRMNGRTGVSTKAERNFADGGAIQVNAPIVGRDFNVIHQDGKSSETTHNIESESIQRDKYRKRNGENA